MAPNKALLEKKQVVAVLQSLTGVVLSFLIIVPGTEPQPVWAWGLILLFALFFLSCWVFPVWIFYLPLFDISILVLNGAFFAFAIILNPQLPWGTLLLYYFLFYLVAITADDPDGLKWIVIQCCVLIALYLILVIGHRSEIAAEGVGVLIGVPSFIALAVLYFYLIKQVRWEKENIEARDRFRTEVVAGIAHDVKQPLAAIVGYTELLLDSLNGHPGRTMVERIGHNSQVIFDLLVGFIDAAKLEALGGEERLPMFLGPVLKSVCEDYSALCLKKDLSFSAVVPDLPELRGNKAQLERVLRNLLSNATKFTPRGGKVAIRASLERGGIKIAVQDTGRGISKEDLPLVFTRFKRFGEKSSEGSGLGLYIVKTIVEAHGGKVSVESRLSAGSVFTVFLPVELKRLQPRLSFSSPPDV